MFTTLLWKSLSFFIKQCTPAIFIMGGIAIWILVIFFGTILNHDIVIIKKKMDICPRTKEEEPKKEKKNKIEPQQVVSTAKLHAKDYIIRQCVCYLAPHSTVENCHLLCRLLGPLNKFYKLFFLFLLVLKLYLIDANPMLFRMYKFILYRWCFHDSKILGCI